MPDARATHPIAAFRGKSVLPQRHLWRRPGRSSRRSRRSGRRADRHMPPRFGEIHLKQFSSKSTPRYDPAPNRRRIQLHDQPVHLLARLARDPVPRPMKPKPRRRRDADLPRRDEDEKHGAGRVARSLDPDGPAGFEQRQNEAGALEHVTARIADHDVGRRCCCIHGSPHEVAAEPVARPGSGRSLWSKKPAWPPPVSAVTPHPIGRAPAPGERGSVGPPPPSGRSPRSVR